MTRQGEGPVALVTGASRGIGRQIALQLADRGFRLAIAARTEKPRPGTPGTLGETREMLAERGAEVIAVRADMASQEDLNALVDATLERYGRIDALVNNAAYTVGKALFARVPDITREQWDKHFAVNVTAPLMLSQACWGPMREQGRGIIINVTSGAAGPTALDDRVDTGLADYGPAYPASKAALNRMANAIAADGAPHGIAVICLEPGFVMTETMAETLGPEGVAASKAISPSIPAAVVAHLCTCDDPMRWSGRVVSAPELHAGLGL